jgi:hypothetical protein
MIGTVTFQAGIEKRVCACLSGEMCVADVRETLQYVAEDKLGRWISDTERRARQILLDGGHNPDRPGDLAAPVSETRLYDAHLILRYVGILRTAMAEHNQDDAIWYAIQIEMIANRHDFFVDYGSASQRGQAFIEGPKKYRTDALTRAITQAFAALGQNASAARIFKFLKENNDFETDEGTIFWTSDNGREKQTSFKSLQNRITRLHSRL